MAIKEISSFDSKIIIIASNEITIRIVGIIDNKIAISIFLTTLSNVVPINKLIYGESICWI